MRRVRVAAAVVCLVGVPLFGLQMRLAAQTREPANDGWQGTPQEEFYNSDIMGKYQCDTCHTIMDRGGTVGRRRDRRCRVTQ